MSPISADLLEILACPLEPERPKLRLEGAFLICDSCQKAFPIMNGIPHLIPEDAIELGEINQEKTWEKD